MLIKAFWTVWNWWFKLPDKIRFLLVGGFNACVQYALYALIIYFWGQQQYQVALILSWIISTISSFTTQKIFVFCTHGKLKDWLREYIKCLGTWILAYIINAVILELLVNLLELNPYIAQIIAISCTTVTSYIMMKHFAFKH